MLRDMGNFRGWEWILILLLALLLFGGFKKLPDAARGVGRSLRIFKAETKGLQDDDEQSGEAPTADSTTADGAKSPSAIDSADSAPSSTDSTTEPTQEPHPVSAKPGNGAASGSGGTGTAKS